MKIPSLILIASICLPLSVFGQNNLTYNAEQYVENADSLSEKFKYDSAALCYSYAAEMYEQELNWLEAAKNYRFTSNVLIAAGKYDTAFFFSNKALSITESHFIENNKDEMFEKSDVFINLADVFEKKGEYDNELDHCKKALELLIKTDYLDSLRIAEIWNKTGISYNRLAKYDSALWYFENALKIKNYFYDSTNIELAKLYLKIGIVYNNKDKFNKAFDYYNKALQVESIKLDKYAPILADSYDLLGTNYYYVADYEKAINLCQRSLDIRKSIFGEWHPDVAKSYNNIGVIYDSKGMQDSALIFYQKDIEISQLIYGNKHSSIPLSLVNIGVIFNNQCKYDLAIKYYLEALQSLSLIYDNYHPYIASVLINIGSGYFSLAEYDKALTFLQNAYNIIIVSTDEQDDNIALIYKMMAGVYNELGDYNKAKEYSIKSLYLYSKIFGENNPQLREIYNQLGTVYYSLEEYEKALKYFHKIVEIIDVDYFIPEFLYSNIGSCYMFLEDYEKALIYFQKEYEFSLSIKGEQHIETAFAFLNLGEINLRLNFYLAAIQNFQKGLNVLYFIYGNIHPNISFAYNFIGQTFYKSQKFDSALQNYQNAIIANIPGYNDITLYSIPNLENAISKKNLLISLINKAEAFFQLYRIETKSVTDIEASITNYDLAFKLINTMRNEYTIETTKLLLSEKTKFYYSEAAHVAIEYNKFIPSDENNSKAFEFIEKGKGAALAARFNEFNAKHFSGIPDSLINVEKEYAININFYTTEIAKEKFKNGGYDTLKVNLLENEHFYYSRKLDSLVTFLEQNYPTFYELKYSDKSTSLSDIQKSLDHESALINYFVSDTILFIASVTDSSYSMKEIEIDSNFKKLVTQYYKNLKTAETESFIANSQLLYEKLVKPFEKDISGKKHLIVLPDEYLYYLPFETLIITPVLTNSQNHNFSDLNYLIKNYSISYNLSANLWYQSVTKSEQKSANTNNFVGFAPVFDKTQNNAQILTSNYNLVNSENAEFSCRAINNDLKKFNPLPYTKDEVSSIVQLFEKNNSEATAYLYDAANESNFKSNASQYKFVHIASHGFSNDEESKLSGIAFAQPVDTANFIEDGILFTGESYNLNLNADLVVLSSCESGMGKLAKGEGLQTQTRGFLYAGAPNIIFSLWKTLDKPTKDLMVNFYSNMLEGESYAESLRLAKLKLIENPKTAMPYFWSSFLIIGK